MIDMTLLPEPWCSEYVPVCAASEGEDLRPRLTLRIGDWLMRRLRYEEIRAGVGACSMTAYPRPPHCFVVGRDVMIENLYPGLWAEDDWLWT